MNYIEWWEWFTFTLLFILFVTVPNSIWIYVLYFKTVLFLFLKETMEYEKPSIHSTMYQFNTYKIMLLAALKTQAGGKETE